MRRTGTSAEGEPDAPDVHHRDAQLSTEPVLVGDRRDGSHDRPRKKKSFLSDLFEG